MCFERSSPAPCRANKGSGRCKERFPLNCCTVCSVLTDTRYGDVRGQNFCALLLQLQEMMASSTKLDLVKAKKEVKEEEERERNKNLRTKKWLAVNLEFFEKHFD